jgi:hypothetical protein
MCERSIEPLSSRRCLGRRLVVTDRGKRHSPFETVVGSVDGRSPLLRENALERRDEHLRTRGLVHELAGGAGALKLVEAAVDDERHVALFQFRANIRRCESIVKRVIDDSCGEGWEAPPSLSHPRARARSRLPPRRSRNFERYLGR